MSVCGGGHWGVLHLDFDSPSVLLLPLLPPTLHRWSQSRLAALIYDVAISEAGAEARVLSPEEIHTAVAVFCHPSDVEEASAMLFTLMDSSGDEKLDKEEVLHWCPTLLRLKRGGDTLSSPEFIQNEVERIFQDTVESAETEEEKKFITEPQFHIWFKHLIERVEPLLPGVAPPSLTRVRNIIGFKQGDFTNVMNEIMDCQVFDADVGGTIRKSDFIEEILNATEGAGIIDEAWPKRLLLGKVVYEKAMRPGAAELETTNALCALGVFSHPSDGEEAARGIFNAIDSDRSGALDVTEIGSLIRLMFRLMGAKAYNAAAATAALEAADTDGSGEVSAEEFVIWFVSNVSNNDGTTTDSLFPKHSKPKHFKRRDPKDDEEDEEEEEEEEGEKEGEEYAAQMNTPHPPPNTTQNIHHFESFYVSPIAPHTRTTDREDEEDEEEVEEAKAAEVAAAEDVNRAGKMAELAEDAAAEEGRVAAIALEKEAAAEAAAAAARAEAEADEQAAAIADTQEKAAAEAHARATAEAAVRADAEARAAHKVAMAEKAAAAHATRLAKDAEEELRAAQRRKEQAHVRVGNTARSLPSASAASRPAASRPAASRPARSRSQVRQAASAAAAAMRGVTGREVRQPGAPRTAPAVSRAQVSLFLSYTFVLSIAMYICHCI